ncbi:hypothetical protein PVAP13_2KG212591 [Panicum virgatum]|uniref:Uncharacterized protein n=1 Tax=Panicum virgatum TaxID=38727 RepID=A0A8T0W824_PANVG|nr:hypothetical protein PVAP13_2KG212591 [Panicum virgatum]
MHIPFGLWHGNYCRLADCIHHSVLNMFLLLKILQSHQRFSTRDGNLNLKYLAGWLYGTVRSEEVFFICNNDDVFNDKIIVRYN